MTVDEGVDITPNQDRGILKRILKEGTGDDVPSAGCKVKVHYVGTFMDGTKFDSSRDRNEPFVFDLGKGSVIKGWDIGIATMKKDELCILTCAPEYAYGSAGSSPKIPPNSTLQFEVEMLDWEIEDLSPNNSKGILRHIINTGTGFDHPKMGAMVTVELEGYLPGVSTPFDKRNVKFNLGEGSESNIVEGIEIALEKFKTGEKSKLSLSPAFGFKAKGNAELKVPENSPLEYIVTLESFEKAKESWLMDNSEKVEQAKRYKEKGINYFKSSKYELAIKMYKQAVSYISSIAEDSEKDKDDVTINARELNLSIQLNLALAYLKLEPPMYFEAKDHATQALKVDPNNVKGLFRRGQALLGIAEPELALEDFQKVIASEPNNKAATNQISICKSAIVTQKQKEKKLYANMFDKFAQKDRQVEERIAKQYPDVMSKALGVWGKGDGELEWTNKERNRAPTEFEKENPNILMLDTTGLCRYM